MGNEHGSGFNKGSTAEQVARDISLQGKNIIVTGANTGLGKETTRVLAKMGAHVIMGCRNMEKAAQAKNEIEAQVENATLTLFKLDLGSLASIESFVENFNNLNIPLHILINNAGIMASPYRETTDGFESQFGTNHIGHFHLTNLLLPKLKEGQPSRVVCLSSSAHKMAQIHWDDLTGKNTWYSGVMGRWNAYGQSKTANILFAVELNRRMHIEGHRITANAIHPGVISTELSRDLSAFEQTVFSLGKPFCKSIPQGAATSIYVATAPELEGIGGKFFENSNESVPKPYATNPRYAERLWNVTVDLIAKAKEANANKPKEDPVEAQKEVELSEEIFEEVDKNSKSSETTVEEVSVPTDSGDNQMQEEVPITAGEHDL